MASSSSQIHMPPSSLIIFFFFTTLFVLATRTSQAREHLVGGSNNAWRVPLPTSQTLNQWAESNRFQVGDTLVWKLKDKDSVLQVSRADYLSCNTSSPIGAHIDGPTVVVELDRSGPYYFISGADNGACEKGEKMAVVVMAERKQNHSGQFFVTGGASPAPAPAVGFEDSPAMAPTSGAARTVVGAVVVGLGVVMGLAV